MNCRNRIMLVAVKASRVLLTALCAVTLLASAPSGQAKPAVPATDLLLPNIELRPGVTIDMHATLFVNQEHRAQGVTLLALHGFTLTGNSCAPFVEALFADNPAGRKVGQVVVLDMPGRGGTSNLVGLPLGEVTLQDYAAALVGSLEALNARKIRPKALLAHSLGTLVVQMAQQRLIEQGTSLRTAFDIQNVVLLGTAAPAAIEDDTSNWLPIIAMAQAFGWTVLPFPAFPVDWRAGLFTDSSGEFIPGTPSLEEIVDKGYIGAEPLPVLLELTGYPPFAVPSVDPGIFSPRHRTLLQTVAYQPGPYDNPVVEAQVYTYLTGDAELEHFLIVPGNTTHALHVANPRYLLESIAGTIVLP